MDRRRIALSAAVLAAAFVPAARAEKAGIRPEFQVSLSGSYTYYGYVYPDAHNEGKESVDIAASAAGAFVVVWEDLYTYRGGYYSYESNPGVWFRRLDSIGRPMGPEFRVSGFTSEAKGGVSVASDAAGRFIVVWDDYNAAPLGDDDHTGILARRYNASGGALGLPFLVNTYTTDGQLTPKVAYEGGGEFMIVWASGYCDGIRGRRFDSGGAAVGTEFQVNTDTSGCPGYSGDDDGSFRDMDIAGDENGTFMVVWSGQGGSVGDGGDIMARLYDSTGTPVGGQFVVNAYTTGNYQKSPSVAADNNGHFVVAWLDASFYSHVFARRFDSTGGAIGGDFQITEHATDYNSYGPELAADAAGSFVVVWDGYDYTGQYTVVYGREIDATGVPLGSQFRVDDTGYDGYEYFVRFSGVAASDAGEFVVVWSQYDYAFEVEGRLLGVAPVACTAAPKTGCKEQTVSKRGAFRFKSSSRNSLAWRWAKGETVTAEDMGNPFATDSYAFCVYDESADPQPLISAAVPAGGACGAAPCWRALSGGRYDYKDRDAYVDGIGLIRVKPGDAPRSRALVRARSENLDLPSTPLTPPVTVQIQVATGTCWTASYDAFVKRNENGVFRALAGSPSDAFLDGVWTGPLD